MSNPSLEQQQLINAIIKKALEKKKNENVIDEDALNSTLESICEVTGISREEAEEIANEVIEKHKNTSKSSESSESSEPSGPSEPSEPSKFSKWSWFFGVWFIASSIGMFSQTFLGALCYLAMACLLLPPVREFVYTKTGKQISSKARGAAIFVLFVMSGVFLTAVDEKKAQDLAIEKAKKQAEVVEQIR